MADIQVSTDEFLSKRKDFVKSGDVLVKARADRSAPSWNPEQRTIRFTMSAEVEDRDRDIVMQAGLNIDEFLKNPQAFYNHNARGFPVGSWPDIEKVLTGRPKRTEGTLKLLPEGTDEVADRLAAHFGVGSIRTCSIGFIPKRVKRREKPEGVKEEDYYWPGYLIEEAELVECSPCTIPSNPAALAKMAADGDVMAREVIEEVLDTWAKHPATGMLIPRSEFEKAHKQASGDRTVIVLDGNKIVAGTIPWIDPDAAPELSEEWFKSAKWHFNGKAVGADTPAGGNNEPQQPETPPTPPGIDNSDNPPGGADPNTPPEQPLTEEQKDGMLARIWKWLAGEPDEEIERRMAEQRRKDAEEAVRAAAMEEVRRQIRDAEKSALQHEIRSTLSELEGKGLA